MSSPIPRWRRLAALGLSLFALGPVLWLWGVFLVLPDRGWLGHPVGMAYAVGWLLAAASPATAAVAMNRNSRLKPVVWGPYTAAGYLLGFVVPGLFSIFPMMLVAGLACLGAALLLTPSGRGLALSLLVTLLTTLTVLAVGRGL